MKNMKKLKSLFLVTCLFLCMICTRITVSAATPVENEYVSELISGYWCQPSQTYVANGITWEGDLWRKSGSSTDGYVTNLHISNVTTQNALKNITYNLFSY